MDYAEVYRIFGLLDKFPVEVQNEFFRRLLLEYCDQEELVNRLLSFVVYHQQNFYPESNND